MQSRHTTQNKAPPTAIFWTTRDQRAAIDQGWCLVLGVAQTALIRATQGGYYGARFPFHSAAAEYVQFEAEDGDDPTCAKAMRFIEQQARHGYTLAMDPYGLLLGRKATREGNRTTQIANKQRANDRYNLRQTKHEENEIERAKKLIDRGEFRLDDEMANKGRASLAAIRAIQAQRAGDKRGALEALRDNGIAIGDPLMVKYIDKALEDMGQ